MNATPYSIIRPIGGGSFGQVFLCQHKKEKQLYVLKKIRLQMMDEKEQESTEMEVRLLSNLRHPNIVGYKESFIMLDTGDDLGGEGGMKSDLPPREDLVLCIVMEYCEHGDLYTLLKRREAKNKGTYSETKVVEWFIQVVLALHFLHERRILHRDLKTQNIFLAGRGSKRPDDDSAGNFALKIGDFGIAKVLDSTRDLAMTQIGTPYYMSPELFKNRPYDFKSDVWALGCILFEMLTFKHAFDAQSINGLAFKILKGKFEPLPASTSEEMKQLVSALLCTNANHRPTLREIFHIPFIRKRIPSVVRTVVSACLPEIAALAQMALFEQLDRLGLASLLVEAPHRSLQTHMPPISEEMARKRRLQIQKIEQKRGHTQEYLRQLEDTAIKLKRRYGIKASLSGEKRIQAAPSHPPLPPEHKSLRVDRKKIAEPAERGRSDQSKSPGKPKAGSKSVTVSPRIGRLRGRDGDVREAEKKTKSGERIPDSVGIEEDDEIQKANENLRAVHQEIEETERRVAELSEAFVELQRMRSQDLLPPDKLPQRRTPPDVRSSPSSPPLSARDSTADESTPPLSAREASEPPSAMSHKERVMAERRRRQEEATREFEREAQRIREENLLRIQAQKSRHTWYRSSDAMRSAMGVSTPHHGSSQLDTIPENGATIDQLEQRKESPRTREAQQDPLPSPKPAPRSSSRAADDTADKPSQAVDSPKSPRRKYHFIGRKTNSGRASLRVSAAHSLSSTQGVFPTHQPLERDASFEHPSRGPSPPPDLALPPVGGRRRIGGYVWDRDEEQEIERLIQEDETEREVSGAEEEGVSDLSDSEDGEVDVRALKADGAKRHLAHLKREIDRCKMQIYKQEVALETLRFPLAGNAPIQPAALPRIMDDRSRPPLPPASERKQPARRVDDSHERQSDRETSVERAKGRKEKHSPPPIRSRPPRPAVETRTRNAAEVRRKPSFSCSPPSPKGGLLRDRLLEESPIVSVHPFEPQTPDNQAAAAASAVTGRGRAIKATANRLAGGSVPKQRHKPVASLAKVPEPTAAGQLDSHRSHGEERAVPSPKEEAVGFLTKQIQMLKRRCRDGLGRETFDLGMAYLRQVRKRDVPKSHRGGPTASEDIVRRELITLFGGERRIGFWALMDQLLHLEETLAAAAVCQEA
ncbi:unnamed protein product [Vitrella brassicaformis CCMP3155]|uniref:non-specific serine/threonine protein kinase n=2 Tax=Vitrella brassicaformis TaxID=1169539 RepID=A0A0G4FRQ7_VITBC|nr:unnamed protein product [Vitrella brassicaformis CCMP3155]|eukprot:CEM17350.1 unnamed protein product [Vitrella brassicaformis CCMP3155]